MKESQELLSFRSWRVWEQSGGPEVQWRGFRQKAVVWALDIRACPLSLPSSPPPLPVLSVSWSPLSLRHLSQVLLGSHTSSSHSGRFLCTPAVSKHSKPLFFCLRSFAEAFSACSVYSQGGWEGEPGRALRSRGQVRCPSLLSFRGTACTVPRMWLSPLARSGNQLSMYLSLSFLSPLSFACFLC